MKNTTLLFAVFSLVVPGLTSAQASFAPPPTWDPMVMVDVTYDPGTKALSVQSEADALQYYTGSTALPVLQLGSNFDPARPEHVLNGKYYSRQLGWNDGTASGLDAYLPSGGYLWISRVDFTPVHTYQVEGAGQALGAYTYTPILDGAGAKWQWDLDMDHNASVVDASAIVANQVYSAKYDIYFGDAQGAELPGYTDAVTTWSWQAPASVPEPSSLGVLIIAGAGLVSSRSCRLRRH